MRQSPNERPRRSGQYKTLKGVVRWPMKDGDPKPPSRSTRIRKAGLRARAGQDIPAERAAFPDPKIQWREARHSAYRCGGSTGIAIACVTGFPFHSEAASLQQSTVRKAPRLSSWRGRILSSPPAKPANHLNFLDLTKMQLTLSAARPIVRAMDHTISLLEQKLDQLISLLEQSRSLNGDLRARLKVAETRTEQLETQMDAARNKLEQVVAHLPETASLS